VVNQVQQSLNLTSTSVLSNTTDVYQAKGPLQDVALATSGGIRAEDIHTTQSVWPSNEVAAKWPQWVLYDECYPSVVWNSSFSSGKRFKSWRKLIADWMLTKITCPFNCLRARCYRPNVHDTVLRWDMLRVDHGLKGVVLPRWTNQKS
jgi:hypothetical protein